MELERNQQLVEIFRGMADLLTLLRDNPYRIRAYRRAADSLERLAEPLEEIARRGEVGRIPGIGRELTAKIDEFLKSGTIQAYETLKAPAPADVADWATLPGLSPPLVRHLYTRLGIRTLVDLETLVRSRLLRTLPGVRVSEEELLNAIAQRRERKSETDST